MRRLEKEQYAKLQCPVFLHTSVEYQDYFSFLVMGYLCDSRLVLTKITVLFNVKTTLRDFYMITLA